MVGGPANSRSVHVQPIDAVPGASLATQWLTPAECETFLRGLDLTAIGPSWRLATRAATERTTAELELRMQDWQRDTAPLVEHYRKRGLLDEIDTEAPVEAVTEALEHIVERRLFERVFAFLPPVAREALDGFTPHPVNLSQEVPPVPLHQGQR